MTERSRRVLKIPPPLILPALGWFVWFLVIPLMIVLLYSFSTKGIYGGVVYEFNLKNYVRATDWIYLRIFWNSIKLAGLTAFFCLLIGYPMAYVMARVKPHVRARMLIMVVIPFWTNFVVRAYGTKVLFGEYGPINQFFINLGWIREPIIFANSDFSVWLGMVMNYLPFMILPLYVTLEKFDFSLLDAAKDLGASSWKILWKVLIPLTQSGIMTGVIFVFTPALGEFVIPDLLGGAKTMLIGNLITEQFLKTRDWPFGAALSLLLILTVMVSLFFYLKVEAANEPSTGKKKKG